MEIKKSVVKSVQSNGTWDSKREPIKTFYKFEVEMENGDIGEYSSVKKDQDKFIKGQEVSYQYFAGKYPKIKPHSDYQNKSFHKKGDREDMIVEQTCLKAAVSYAAAYIAAGNEFTPEDVIKYKDIFKASILGNKDKTEIVIKKEEDDLPF